MCHVARINALQRTEIACFLGHGRARLVAPHPLRRGEQRIVRVQVCAARTGKATTSTAAGGDISPCAVAGGFASNGRAARDNVSLFRRERTLFFVQCLLSCSPYAASGRGCIDRLFFFPVPRLGDFMSDWTVSGGLVSMYGRSSALRFSLPHAVAQSGFTTSGGKGPSFDTLSWRERRSTSVPLNTQCVRFFVSLSTTVAPSDCRRFTTQPPAFAPSQFVTSTYATTPFNGCAIAAAGTAGPRALLWSCGAGRTFLLGCRFKLSPEISVALRVVADAAGTLQRKAHCSCGKAHPLTAERSSLAQLDCQR